MRLAFTIGITNDNQAVILKDHNSILRDHKDALRGDAYKGEYKEIFILESSRSNKHKRFSEAEGGVNRGAALPVAGQTKAKMSAAASEMKGGTRGNPEGKVNFEKASQTVAEQQGRKPARKRTRRGKKSSASKSATRSSASPKASTPPPLPSGKDEGSFPGAPSL
jgi:hypothetical protein